jgi:hypothetical protein
MGVPPAEECKKRLNSPVGAAVMDPLPSTGFSVESSVMTLEEIAARLPSGLRDASLEELKIDWLHARIDMTLRVCGDSSVGGGDYERRVRIAITGLVFCEIEAPALDSARGYGPGPEQGLWIDAGPGAGDEGAKARLPKTPEGCFVHWLFVHRWSRFIHICARHADMAWMEADPRSLHTQTDVLFETLSKSEMQSEDKTS